MRGSRLSSNSYISTILGTFDSNGLADAATRTSDEYRLASEFAASKYILHH